MLTKICTISAVLGTILLILIMDKIELQTSSISKINKEDINKFIKIKGIASKVIIKGTVTLLEIEDKSGKIEVILFKTNKIKINKGSFLEVEGKIALQEKSLIIYADSIKIIN